MAAGRHREIVHQRDAQAGGDECLHRLQVVRLEPDPRREAGVGAEEVEHLPVGARGPVGRRDDPLIVREVAHPERPARGEAVAGGQDGTVLVVEKLRDLESFQIVRADAVRDGEVGVARAQQRQARLRLGFADDDLHGGTLTGEPGDRRRQEGRERAANAATRTPGGFEGFFFEAGLPAIDGEAPPPLGAEEIERSRDAAIRHGMEVRWPEVAAAG